MKVMLEIYHRNSCLEISLLVSVAVSVNCKIWVLTDSLFSQSEALFSCQSLRVLQSWPYLESQEAESVSLHYWCSWQPMLQYKVSVKLSSQFGFADIRLNDYFYFACLWHWDGWRTGFWKKGPYVQMTDTTMIYRWQHCQNNPWWHGYMETTKNTILCMRDQLLVMSLVKKYFASAHMRS